MSMTHVMITIAEHDRLLGACAERDRLHALVNTPELVDFPKAVYLEAVHQEERWGTTDRQGKTPNDWFWLVGHLASRALEHHKEAERLAFLGYPAMFGDQIAHHREKATHHCITAAAALNHWHASMLGKARAMQPGHAPSIAAAAQLDEGILEGTNRTTSGAIGQP
jgi:hypothetical protein